MSKVGRNRMFMLDFFGPTLFWIKQVAGTQIRSKMTVEK